MWTWRPWSLFKPREHSCMGDILMQTDKDAGHRLSFSLSPPLFLSIMRWFRNSHTNRRTAWWGPWNVIMSLPCVRSMKWWEGPWRLTGSRSWLLWGGNRSRKWHHNRLSLSLFLTRARSLFYISVSRSLALPLSERISQTHANHNTDFEKQPTVFVQSLPSPRGWLWINSTQLGD